MATLEVLKQALLKEAVAIVPSHTQPLSDAQYDVGFEALVRDGQQPTYQKFVVPQLADCIATAFATRTSISVLEIGPGPATVLASLPERQRRKIRAYAAFEPHESFAKELERSLGECLAPQPFPSLQALPIIRRARFTPEQCARRDSGATMTVSDGSFDLILFCHSMYGMSPRRKYIEAAISMLRVEPTESLVVVFHRGQSMDLDGLICHRTAVFPVGLARVKDSNDILDSVATFVAGRVMQDKNAHGRMLPKWRTVCRALAHRDSGDPNYLTYSAPNIMMTFTRHATALPELLAQVIPATTIRHIKSREARKQCPAAIIRPADIGQVQKCVRWALSHGLRLTIVGGGHSSHCLWPGVIALDMSAFGGTHLIRSKDHQGSFGVPCNAYAVVESGCTTGGVIRTLMSEGFTLPVGARPSVGAGSWLQGGMGHSSRYRGLTCDSIVGAVMVGVSGGEIYCIGYVPSGHQPRGAMRPENEDEMLWALKGAGTNFGVVISLVMGIYPAASCSVHNWILQVEDTHQLRFNLDRLDAATTDLPSNRHSVDVFTYWEQERLHLGVTKFDHSESHHEDGQVVATFESILGAPQDAQVMSCLELFEADLYMSKMHGGHESGKTSTFKRCLFLRNIGKADIANILAKAMHTRPTPSSYLHLLHGGGAIEDYGLSSSAFACRDWHFACVITAVWPRELDGHQIAQTAIRWVYEIAYDLLPICHGVYGADLGPDPRDAALALKAYGSSMTRLTRLKQRCDPSNLLAYAFPLSISRSRPKLIVLVTGLSCSGKDYCAHVWASIARDRGLSIQLVSISDVTKREYAAAVGADLGLLLTDRAYKEQHRARLSAYFQKQLQQQPTLLQDHFMTVVQSSEAQDILVITGLRESAPALAYAHLAPASRLVEVNVECDRALRKRRRGLDDGNDDGDAVDHINNQTSQDSARLVLQNSENGPDVPAHFFHRRLLPFCSPDLQALADMVNSVADFPRPGVEFRHLLGIAHRQGGLKLCSSLMKSQFVGDWEHIDIIACCEASGFVFASPLAVLNDMRLAVMREGQKLPPPVITVDRVSSHISSFSPADSFGTKTLAIGCDVIPRDSSVLVVDDVLATGETLCAVLRLLRAAGIQAEKISVMVVAEFPSHRGRNLLRTRGFGNIQVHSLLIFDGF